MSQGTEISFSDLCASLLIFFRIKCDFKFEDQSTVLGRSPWKIRCLVGFEMWIVDYDRVMSILHA